MRDRNLSVPEPHEACAAECCHKFHDKPEHNNGECWKCFEELMERESAA